MIEKMPPYKDDSMFKNMFGTIIPGEMYNEERMYGKINEIIDELNRREQSAIRNVEVNNPTKDTVC